MTDPAAFAALARAIHHQRHREALSLIDALLLERPGSEGLQRQRHACIEALDREAEERVQPPHLMRVDAGLFSFDQQRECNAPAPDLRALGFTALLDAASPGFTTTAGAPILLRFFGEESGDSVIVRFSAVLNRKPEQLLACASLCSDQVVLVSLRETDWAFAEQTQTNVQHLPARTSLAELVTRHAGRCATRLRDTPGLSLRALRQLADCDRIWRAINP